MLWLSALGVSGSHRHVIPLLASLDEEHEGAFVAGFDKGSAEFVMCGRSGVVDLADHVARPNARSVPTASRIGLP